MGSLFSAFRSEDEVRLIIRGMEGSGKTTTLYRLKLADILSTGTNDSLLEQNVARGTLVGFNTELVTFNKETFTVWDIGGNDTLSPSLWRHYYDNTAAIIFVVDSTKREQIHAARAELHRLLSLQPLRHALFLIYANKQDLSNTMDIAEMTERLALQSVSTERYLLHPCSALSGAGMNEGFAWLVNALRDQQQRRK